MKNKFIEYYSYTEEELKEIWEQGIIVFDTNTLLNLYRCTNNTRSEFIKILSKYQTQLWMPYQVAFEYHRNRRNVISNTINDYKKVDQTVNDAFENFFKQLKIDSLPLGIDKKAIEDIINKCKERVEKIVKNGRNSYPDFSNEDKVLDNITNLYENRVGDDFSKEDLEKIYAEGKYRYENKISPGYCDKKEKGKNNSEINELVNERRLYGDLIIWKEVINKALTDNKHVILVTNDMKEDWWEQVAGQHIPRIELIREFIKETGRKIKIYSFRRFMKQTGIENTEPGKKAMEEIKVIGYQERFLEDFVTRNLLCKCDKKLNTVIVDETNNINSIYCNSKNQNTVQQLSNTYSNLDDLFVSVNDSN